YTVKVVAGFGGADFLRIADTQLIVLSGLIEFTPCFLNLPEKKCCISSTCSFITDHSAVDSLNDFEANLFCLAKTTRRIQHTRIIAVEVRIIGIRFCQILAYLKRTRLIILVTV